MADITINGKTLSSLSAYVYETADARHVAPRRFPAAALYGRAGAAPGTPVIGARTLTIGGRIVTSANTVAARVAAEHVLKDHLSNAGLMAVTIDEGTSPDLTIDGLLESLAITPIGHPLQAVVSEFSAVLTCPDAIWRDSAGPIVVSAPTAATRYNLPLGTAPSTPRLTVLGAATTPTVTIRDSGGTAQVTLVFATLASTDTLEVDCAAGTITKYASGTAANGISQLTSGTFPFRLDPAWGDYGNSRWPTVETSDGDVEVLYSKRFW
jgi:phage-related protein